MGAGGGAWSGAYGLSSFESGQIEWEGMGNGACAIAVYGGRMARSLCMVACCIVAGSVMSMRECLHGA